jgi:hypothetical protein
MRGISRKYAANKIEFGLIMSIFKIKIQSMFNALVQPYKRNTITIEA